MTPPFNNQKQTDNPIDISKLIRFEEKKESPFMAGFNQILFVRSADHYVKALIKNGDNCSWMTRHCTLKEIQTLLPGYKFMRLNRFYIVNRDYFSYIDVKAKCLYLSDGIAIPISHRVSRFVISGLNG